MTINRRAVRNDDVLLKLEIARQMDSALDAWSKASSSALKKDRYGVPGIWVRNLEFGDNYLPPLRSPFGIDPFPSEKILESPRLCYPMNKGGHVNAHSSRHRAERY